jgi:protein-L-isoaspartate(D-aspartate) O-methyltransferase
MPSSAGDRANQMMVDRLIAQGVLWSPALIAAFRATPRHRFLYRVLLYEDGSERGWREIVTQPAGPRELRIIYTDRALITRLQPGPVEGVAVPVSSSSQPGLMSQMLEDLRLRPDLRTLEIGAGTGYNAALLAHVVGPGKVTSLDVDRHVLAEARSHLQAFADRQVDLRHADGRLGFPEGAPWDRIMVTAASFDLEPSWLRQCAEGGLIVAPLAFAPGLAFVVRGSVTGGVFEGSLTRPAYFMPLRAEQEVGSPPPGEAAPAPPPLRTVAPPWTNWGEPRRMRHLWPGLLQSLAFYGWLRGWQATYHSQEDGETAYALHDLLSGGFCLLGTRNWSVNGEEGARMGRTLWRAFLNAGGPRPTEFRLRLTEQGTLQPVTASESYIRNGPRFRQVWELIEPRERPGWS